jgi:DNA-binding NtrC family response regulator
MNKIYNILYINDERSSFNENSSKFDECFTHTIVVNSNEEALKQLEINTFDIILSDLSVEPEKAGILKKIIDENMKQIIFALVDPKDTKKLYGIADMGVNAFELTPDQFDQALEMISQFDPKKQY